MAKRDHGHSSGGSGKHQSSGAQGLHHALRLERMGLDFFRDLNTDDIDPQPLKKDFEVVSWGEEGKNWKDDEGWENSD